MSREESSPEQMYRLLPGLDELLRWPELIELTEKHSRVSLVGAARSQLAQVRSEIARGEHTAETLQHSLDALPGAVSLAMDAGVRSSLVPVLNATGVILHTNLGRAPLSEPALQAIVEVGRAYSNLEFDLETGRRGARDRHAEPMLLRALAALADREVEHFGDEWNVAVVNNCAAATFLALDSLGRGGEVLVSRGELVEIGGGFRVPDILRKAGVALREVGTTNRTRVADYAEAINENTTMILRVHQSNFSMEGFTERPSLADLVELGRRAKLTVFEDQGTGLLMSLDGIGVKEQSSLLESFLEGPDLIAASGDKLLGGPQCGLLLGRRELLQTIRRNPLYRALRVDKLTYAALQATLLSYATQQEEQIPTIRMLRIPCEELRVRCEAMRERTEMPGVEVAVLPVKSVIGGGTTPAAELGSFAVALRHASVSSAALMAALRRETPPVIGRVQDDCVMLDLRTVPPEQDGLLAEAVRNAVERTTNDIR